MPQKKVPKHLQGVLWSVDVEKLDIQKNKHYIINQIFSYGTGDEIRWLFRTYPFETLVDTFVHYPIKDYRGQRYQFVKNYLLQLSDQSLNPLRYVKNIPRDIRR